MKNKQKEKTGKTLPPGNKNVVQRLMVAMQFWNERWKLKDPGPRVVGAEDEQRSQLLKGTRVLLAGTLCLFHIPVVLWWQKRDLML